MVKKKWTKQIASIYAKHIKQTYLEKNLKNSEWITCFLFVCFFGTFPWQDRFVITTLIYALLKDQTYDTALKFLKELLF